MRATQIDLSESFTSILTLALSLPEGRDLRSSNEEEVIRAARCLYDAAHGRAVETQIGSIAIAPAVASYLKATPFYVKSRGEFLALVEANSSFRCGSSRAGHSETQS